MTKFRHHFRFTILIQTGFFLLTTLFVYSTAAVAAPIPAAPKLAARAYLLQDANSGYIIASQNADQRMEPASLTKLMTAYIVFNELKSGTIHLDDETVISEKAWHMGGSKMFIEVNKHVKVEDLLKGMIIQSGNDASVALAEFVAGSEESFASLMNNYAKNLGMTNTHFVDATGMPNKEHYTTAADLARLAIALIDDFPEYYPLYSIRKFTYNNITQYNRNKLLWRDDSVDGIKTGHTESAGYCLVSSAERNDMRLIAVVLGTHSEDARAQESQKLLNYGFRFYETRPLYTANATLTRTRIWEGGVDELPLGLTSDLYITIPRGRYGKVDAKMEIQDKIMAPAKKGQTFGTVHVTLEGKNLAERPLVALHDVGAGDFVQRMSDKIMLFFE